MCGQSPPFMQEKNIHLSHKIELILLKCKKVPGNPQFGSTMFGTVTLDTGLSFNENLERNVSYILPSGCGTHLRA